MFVLALELDLHLPECRSLKSKRAVLRPVTDGLRARFRISVAEVGEQDRWQRAKIGVAVVGATAGHVQDVMDEVERFVWAQPGLDVLSAERTWLEN